MNYATRIILACAAGVLGLLQAHAQTPPAAPTPYPTKPVRIIVPLGAGGASDVIARQLAQILGDRNGQPFVVDNRPGANTIIGSDACTKATPDGSTLCVVTGSSVSINPFLYRKLPYAPDKDFEAVAPLVRPDMIILASPKLPFRNMQEMLAYARGNPGKLAYGSFGNGSDTHMIMEWFKRQTRTDLLHVPFNGFGPMLQAFNSGAIQLMYLSVGNPGIVAQVKSGAMLGMAVLAPGRTPQLPEIPTLAETGIDPSKAFVWFGLMAPAHTPPEIVAKLNQQVTAAMQAPAMREQLNTMAMRTQNQSPAEFAAFLRQDREVWRDLVTQSGVSLD